MAVQNDDLMVLQRSSGGPLLKTTVGSLLNQGAPTLQEVTDKGDTTTNDINLTGHLVCGDKIFGGADVTNVGTEIHPTKGAVHVRPANDTDIAAFEVLGHDTAKSHYKVHGDGKLEIGENIASGSIGATVRQDGSSTFNGAMHVNKEVKINSTSGGSYSLHSVGNMPSFHASDFWLGGSDSNPNIKLNADGLIEAVRIDGNDSGGNYA